jgi:thioredoxin reductase
LRAYAGDVVELHVGERAQSLQKTAGGFSVATGAGSYEARAVLVATGGMRRKLQVPGAAQFENKGLTYCASCDGPLFAGQDTAVVGGGNAGFETAAQLLAYTKSVTLVHRSESFSKADPSTVEAVLKHPNMKALTDTEPVAVKGEQFVTALTVKNNKTGAQADIPVAGIFVEIGMVPSTDFARGLVDLDEFGRVKVNPKNQRASVEGIWAAGDCTDELYHQNNIAAGDGVKALEDIYFWLKRTK